MMQTATPEKCALGLDARALSAWRDSATAQRQAARIAEHVGSCPSCQAHLAAFERVAEELRRQRLPRPRPSLWREIQERHAHTAPRRWRSLRVPRAPLWGGVGAAAAAVLVALLFAQILGGRAAGITNLIQTAPTQTGSAVSTGVATPTLGPSDQPATLNWQEVASPRAPALLGPRGMVLAVAPSDGNTAYACYSGLPPQLWVTHDRAATWTRVSTVPSGQAGCRLTVDALDPSIVLASTYPVPSPTQPPYDNFLSTDGGATWRTLGSDKGQHVDAFATFQGVTVATREQTASLAMSADGFVTWQPIDAPTVAAHQLVERFWMNRADGSILAQTVGRDLSGSTSFWTASATGGGWTQLGAAPNRLTSFVVQQPRIAGEAWHICGVGYASAPGGTPAATGSGNIPVLNDVQCSLDGGASWQERPVLAVPHNSSQAASQAIPPQGVFAIAGDGALLAVDGDYPSSGTPALTLYTLSRSGSAWSAAGDLPSGGTLFYAPTGVGGVLWLVPDFAATDVSRSYFTAAYLFG